MITPQFYFMITLAKMYRIAGQYTAKQNNISFSENLYNLEYK